MSDADILRFQTADGFNIAYRCWNATKPVKRVVVCIHGIGDYSGWFKNLAPELTLNGNQVCALDLRGFGDSIEEGFPRGHVSNFRRHLQDIDDFVRYIRKINENKKIYVLGHSLGGVYSIWYATIHPGSADGLILAAPAVDSALNSRKNGLIILFLKTFNPGSTHNLFASSDSKRDHEEIEIMLKDPREANKLTVKYLSDIRVVLLKDALRNVSNINVPTLILQGEADATVPPQGAKWLYQKLLVKDKELALFSDAGHWFYDALSPSAPRTMFNSSQREKFISTINVWLGSH